MTDYYVCGFVALWLCGFRFSIFECCLPNTHVRYGVLMKSCDNVYGTVRYQYRYGNVQYRCTYRTVWYIYRTVRYRIENLEIVERGEADPI